MGREQRADRAASSGEQDSHVTRDTVTLLARCDAELAAGCVARARCVTVRPGLLCHDTGQRKHRTQGHAGAQGQEILRSTLCSS